MSSYLWCLCIEQCHSFSSLQVNFKVAHNQSSPSACDQITPSLFHPPVTHLHAFPSSRTAGYSLYILVTCQQLVLINIIIICMLLLIVTEIGNYCFKKCCHRRAAEVSLVDAATRWRWVSWRDYYIYICIYIYIYIYSTRCGDKKSLSGFKNWSSQVNDLKSNMRFFLARCSALLG